MSAERLPARMRHIIMEAASGRGTAGTNIAAGEDVRWLPRRLASGLCLPGNDFWLFDDRLIRFHHFSGDDEIVEDELCADPGIIAMCAAAFDAVWEHAIPHANYRLA